jgi:hypothetical protein
VQRCRRRFVLALSTACVGMSAHAQSSPHLQVEMRIQRGAGTLSARACLFRIPDGARTEFLLHRGLNVRSVRDGSGARRRVSGEYDGRFVGEGIVYTLRDAVAASDTLCVEYGGAYPVYSLVDDDFGDGDFKGRIAFADRTVRAAEQAKWYPIPYDSTLGPTAHQGVTFRASIRCDDCAAIYLNGDAAKPGPQAIFASTMPVPMLLFAGEFTTEHAAGLTVINGTRRPLPPGAVARLAATTEEIRRFLESWMRVPYRGSPVFIQHTLTEDSPRRRWGFATFPTIAFSNDGVGAFVDSTGATVPFAWGYLGHEMAHHYFGGVLLPNGPYKWFLTESTAEYLGLQVIRRFVGDSAYRARVATFMRAAAADSMSPRFDRIGSANEIDERYRYQFGPLLLVALEERVGSEPLQRFLASLLRDRHRRWDYPAFREALLAAGVPPTVLQDFEEACVRPRFSDSCLARTRSHPSIKDSP